MVLPSNILEMIASEKFYPYREIIQARREEVYNNYLLYGTLKEESVKEEKAKMEYWYPVFIEYFITWKINENLNQPSAVNLCAFFLAVDDL